MSSAALPSLLGLAALILVPGLLTTAAIFPPGRLAMPGRLTLAFAAGFVVTSLSAWILICFSALDGWSFLLVLSLVTVGAGIVALRRGSPRAHADALRAELNRDRFTSILGLAVIVAIGWAMSGASTLFSLDSDTPMRFWGDGVEIAGDGGIPDKTLQWGESWDPATSKMLFNSHTAGMASLFDEVLPAVSAAMWLVSIFFCAALWWVAWELGLRWTSSLLPLLTLANITVLATEIPADVRPYRAEAFGRVIAFAALALAIAAVRDKEGWSHHLFAGALFGVAAATHLVPTVLCIAMLGGYCLYRLARRAFSVELALRLAAALGVAAVILALVWSTPGANLAFQGTSRADAGSIGGIDQVALYVTGERESIAEARARTWYEDPSVLMSEFVEGAMGLTTDTPWVWLVVEFVALSTLVFLVTTRLQGAATVAWTLFVAIIAATLLFDFIYSSYAQALFGPRRLFDYGAIPTWLLLSILTTSGLYALDKHRPEAPALVTSAIVLVLAIVLLPDVHSKQPPTFVSGDLEELQWVRDNTSCDARLLTNRHTGGTYQVFTGRVNVNEGMGPFFRPTMLAYANDLLLDMNEFFKKPAAHRTFVEEWGLDYIVMARGRAGADANIRSAPGYPARMERTDFLELAFAGERSNIYRVTAVESSGDFPDPADYPGHECRRGRIPT